MYNYIRPLRHTQRLLVGRFYVIEAKSAGCGIPERSEGSESRETYIGYTCISVCWHVSI